MAQLCICFDDKPPDRSKPPKNRREANYFKFYDYGNTFSMTMCDAVTQGQPCCILGTIPCCVPCVQFKMREKALTQVGNGMSDYICGQGYLPACCCWRPGKMGEQSCPEVCLFCEGCCCPGLAVSATRMLTMDAYQIQPDPCDNKIIQFNNCMQILSCFCHILAILEPSCRECADIVDCIADAVFFSTVGCMTAQTYYELEKRKDGGGEIVAAQGVVVGTVAGGPAEAEMMER